MKSGASLVIMAAAFAAVSVVGSATLAQDAITIINQRQDVMKAQGKALAAVKAYTEDKGDLAAARVGGADLVKTTQIIPSLFAQKTGMAEYPGKSYAKPEVWAQWDKFNEAARAASAKAAQLNAALQSGDKAAIATAFGGMSKEGCDGCHTTFRARKT